MSGLAEAPFAAVLSPLGRKLGEELFVEWVRAFDEDPEGLHDFRVAVRHLRTFLRALRGDVTDEGFAGLDRRVRTLFRATGEARDLDVMHEWLVAFAKEARPTHRPGLDLVAARLEGWRRKARRRLHGLLTTSERTELEREVAQVFGGGPLAVREPDRTLGVVLAERAPALLAELEAAAQEAATGRAEPLHEVRLCCKRLRYFVTMFGELAELPDRDVVKPLKAMQDLLGHLHDRDEQLPRVLRELRRLEVSGLEPLRRRSVRRAEARREGGALPYAEALAALARPRPPERLGLVRAAEALVAERRALGVQALGEIEGMLTAVRKALGAWLVGVGGGGPVRGRGRKRGSSTSTSTSTSTRR